MFTEKEVRIRIESTNYEVEASLFGIDGEDGELSLDDVAAGLSPDKTEVKTFGKLRSGDGRIEIIYEESEATGLEGSTTSISFDIAQPGIVTMMRTGMVSTAFVFEKGKRHHCVYNTPYMPFEVCVKTVDVKNHIVERGALVLDYFVEIRGAKAERTKLFMRIMD